jgi:gamma-glutamyl hydrolase
MKLNTIVILAIFLFINVSLQQGSTNYRPIIGLLTIPSNFPQHPNPLTDSYILGTDAQFLEAGGCRVAPLPWNIVDVNFTFILNSVNGIAITGRAFKPYEQVVYLAYLARIKEIVNFANAQNQKGNYYPLFGIGDGFQLLSAALANQTNLFMNLTNNFTNHILQIQNSNRMFSLFPSYLISNLQAKPTFNFNNINGLDLTSFQQNSALSGILNAVAFSVDDKNNKFISALEGISLPYYLVQFRPQSNLFDWSMNNYNHDYNSELSTSLLTNFMINETRRNTNTFPSPAIEDIYLIYCFNFTFINITYPRVYFLSIGI